MFDFMRDAFVDPTKVEKDVVTVSTDGTGRLVVAHNLVTSIDISTEIGRSLVLRLAGAIGGKHPTAAAAILRAVTEVLTKQKTEDAPPPPSNPFGGF